MAKLRPEEEWARRVIELHLGRTVHPHDDGSTPSMFDLRVGPVDAPEVAIEVTGAIDGPWTATWNAGQKLSGRVAGVDGDWTFEVCAGAQVKPIIKELPHLVTAIRAAGLGTVREEDMYFRPELRAHFDRLGVTSAYCHGELGSGNVYFTLDGDGGAVDSLGESVPGWGGEFLVAPARADVIRKLMATTAPQREVFILADVDGAPWAVMSYLTDISGWACAMPPTAPTLPPPVTGVWLASTYFFGDCRGVHWDGARWSPFRSRGAGIDDNDT